MAEKKHQHYIPQNYLRGFSSDGKNAGIFYIDKEIFKPKKGVKNIAQINYFYTENPDLENNLSDVENIFAQNRKSIIDDPFRELNVNQKEVLYQDMFIQMVRVPALQDLYNEMVNAFAHRVWDMNPNEEVRAYAKDCTAEIKNAIIPAMMTILKDWDSCYDLKAKLLINKCDCNFITSDNPVVLNNTLFEYNGWETYGLKSDGLQIYYPLSPRLAVLYYDDKVYKVGRKKHDFVEITDFRNVNMLNIWIMVNASKLLIFDDSIKKNYISEMYGYAKKYRLASKREEHEIKLGDAQSYIIAKSKHPFFKFRQTYIKLLDKYKHYDNFS